MTALNNYVKLDSKHFLYTEIKNPQNCSNVMKIVNTFFNTELKNPQYCRNDKKINQVLTMYIRLVKTGSTTLYSIYFSHLLVGMWTIAQDIELCKLQVHGGQVAFYELGNNWHCFNNCGGAHACVVGLSAVTFLKTNAP